MKSYRVFTLGCRTNQYESQAYKDQLKALNFQEASEDDPLDLCIVNTCTVTQSAENSSQYTIKQIAKKHPHAKILVTGCAVEGKGKAAGLQSLSPNVEVFSNVRKETLLKEAFPEKDFPEFSIKQFEAHTRAFVKVQDGCNSFCTYCIIPYVRGRSRSRSMEDILSEVQGLLDNGYKDIVLTGINIGDFDGGKARGEKPNSLADLVRAVDSLDKIERLRISSIDPDEVDDELLEAIITGKHTCHSMHIVLQSGSNVILKKMNRKYTRQIFLDTVQRLQSASPFFTFTTDVIVGFPGENEKDHQETLDMIENVGFSKVHMFPYSARERTRAALYPDPVSHKVIQKRKQEILRLSEKIAYQKREAYVGKKMHVLTEGKNALIPGTTFGHSDNFLPIFVEGPNLASNQIIECQVYANSQMGLLAR